jgi:uncharacterized membrane-anchored protein YhcB (DUF1043 family)
MSLIATVLWFAISWAFILGVLFKRWGERQRRDQTATETALKRTRRSTDDSHIWDAL